MTVTEHHADARQAARREEPPMIALAILAIVTALAMTALTVRADRREARRHRDAAPPNRVVGDSHNRIFD